MASNTQVIGQILDLLQEQTASGSLTWEGYNATGFRAVFGNQVVFVEVEPFVGYGPSFEIRNNRGELIQKVTSPAGLELDAAVIGSAMQTRMGKGPSNISTDGVLRSKVSKLLDAITNFDRNKTNKELNELLTNLKRRSEKP